MKKPRNGKPSIVAWSTGRKRGQFGLVIGGRRIQLGKKQIRLLLRLYKDLGRVVSHDELCAVVGYRGARGNRLNNLSTHLYFVRQTLTAHKLPVALTVAKGFGYALCEIAR